MRQIRKSHTNEIIDRRLRDCEMADRCDAMELIGLFDELARVERKWLANRKRIEAGEPNRRPLADEAALNGRFERLVRLIETSLRKGVADAGERQLLENIQQKLKSRTPVKR